MLMSLLSLDLRKVLNQKNLENSVELVLDDTIGEFLDFCEALHLPVSSRYQGDTVHQMFIFTGENLNVVQLQNQMKLP